MSRARFGHSYHNNNDLIAFDEFADQLQTLPRAHTERLNFPNGQPSKWSAVVDDKTITDKDGNESLVQYASVTDNYTLVQHSDVMFDVLNTIQASGIDGNARVKHFGGKCYMDMVFSNLKIEDPTGNDISLGYTVRNSYDKTSAINLFPFAIRGICSNGSIFKMTPELGLEVITINHMGEVIDRVRDGMKSLIENTMRVKGVFIEMLERATRNIIEFKADELELTMSSYTGSRKSARDIIESSGIPLTGDISQWQIYCAMTQYASWNAQSGATYERISTGAEKLFNENHNSLDAARQRAMATITV